MDITTSQLAAKQAKQIDAKAVFQRMFLTFIGSALVMAAFGIWLASSVAHDPGMLLIKMGVSIFMLVAGISCLLLARH